MDSLVRLAHTRWKRSRDYPILSASKSVDKIRWADYRNDVMDIAEMTRQQSEQDMYVNTALSWLNHWEGVLHLGNWYITRG